jgi:transcriptional regulator with XRE-family HTH domain
MDLRHRFAANVKRLRDERKLSQEAFAEKANLHRTYISGIERGLRNVGIDNIEVIAKALGVEPAYLFVESKRASLLCLNH